jgi:hypothetical protein
MKRILVLLSVVALMVVMLAMSVAPAFAAWDAENGQCRTGGHLIATGGNPLLEKEDQNNDDRVCWIQTSTGTGEHPKTTLYDNRGTL